MSIRGAVVIANSPRFMAGLRNIDNALVLSPCLLKADEDSERRD